MPPFGANGLGFNKAGNALFVANTGNDTIVKIPVTAGSPGTPAVFVNSINGADGIVLDSKDNLWVAANQADEIVVVDPTGKAIAKLGDFDGLDQGRRAARPAVSGEPRFQQRRQIPLRQQSDAGSAAVRAASSRSTRNGPAQGQALHHLADQGTVIPRGHGNSDDHDDH